MDIFYVVEVIKNNKRIALMDYPDYYLSNFPIPNVGDEMVFNDNKSNKYSGVITKKRFTVKTAYCEIMFTLKLCYLSE